MTPQSNRWMLAVLSVSLVWFGVACSDHPAPTNANTGEKTATLREPKPGERTCVLVLTDDLKRHAKEVSVGLWEKDKGEQTIVSFVLPDRAELDLTELGIVVAEIPGSERERNAFIYVEGTGKDGNRLGISSTVGRFQYLGKNEYALGWASRTTVLSVGRRNIQSVGKYDGSDFKTGTEHNRLILYYEVK